MLRSKLGSYLMTMALGALCTAPLLAQEAGSQPGQSPGDQSTVNTATTTQTMTPISGLQVLSPSFGGDSHDFALPAAGCTEHANNNPTGFERHASVFSETSCVASISVQKVGRNTELNLQDAGGVFFFSPAIPVTSGPNIKQYGGFDELGITAVITGRRWKWILGNDGMYMPETPMGFPGFAGLTSFGSGMGGMGTSSAPALNSTFQPNQGIYSGLSSRISDLAETEVQYVINAHSIFTATGMFGTLQSLTAGFIDDDYGAYMAGYNRFFGRGNRDVAAVTYMENHYVFSGGRPGFSTRGVSILYGHTFSPKLAIQLSVAPMVNDISLVQGPPLQRFFVSTFNSVQYRNAKWSTGLAFDRSMTGGAGILTGSVRNSVNGDVGRMLGRKIRGQLRSSYSNNQSIAGQSTHAYTYNFWEAGLSLSREFGPHFSMYLNYQAERQVSNNPICIGANCSTVFLRQVLGVGFDWHGRALNIE